MVMKTKGRGSGGERGYALLSRCIEMMDGVLVAAGVAHEAGLGAQGVLGWQAATPSDPVQSHPRLPLSCAGQNGGMRPVEWSRWSVSNC
jgi:hypothetical protein